MVLVKARHGVGLRSVHFDAWLTEAPTVGIVEAVTENFAGRGGRARRVLESVRRDNAVVLHGVSLGVGDASPLRRDKLRLARELADELEVEWMSDQLCFTGFGGHTGHDLWPLPLTEETVEHVASRIIQAHEILGRRLALENISSYVRLGPSEMTECEFISAVAERSDCELLLDLNNVIVNAHNHGFDARNFVANLPTSRLRQLHLAGHADMGFYLFDDHRGPVPEDVWDLYRHCVAVHGPIPSVIEWDLDTPSLARVIEESARAAAIEAKTLSLEATA